MDGLHIEGYLDTDYHGCLAVNGTALWERVADFADEHGVCVEHNKGLGGTKAFIQNVNLRIYTTEDKCELEEAEVALLAELDGFVEIETELTGYSEYTITGLNLEEFSIGGHNLESELWSKIGDYIHFVMEVK